MLFKSKDELISIVHTKSKELPIVDIRNKKQRYQKQKAKISETKSKDIKNKNPRLLIEADMRTKIFIKFFITMH